MKVSILVKSPLLERTLQLYLREYLVNVDECDFVITDEVDEALNKPICLINFNEDSDILRPIYRDSLMGDLSRFNAKVREIRKSFETSNVLDLGELSRLKKSIDLINGIEPKPKNTKNAENAPAQNKDKDIKDKIDIIVQDFANKLYEAIKGEK